MKIFVVNCGSSSLKYQLINMDNNDVLATGKCDRIGEKGSLESPIVEYKKLGGEKLVKKIELPDHTIAFEEVMKFLTDKEVGVISDLNEIDAVGHRVVNGGPNFKEPVIINDEVMTEFKKRIDYAPLHNPAHLQGIEACTKLMPNTPQSMVFDTSFHSSIPEVASTYAIPYEYTEKYGIKRYGAHGTSHKYVSNETAKVLGKEPKDVNVIVCHLGNGSSITAVKAGKSVDTSMGLTPLEGVPMGTRSGSLDPAVLGFIMNKENLSIDEMTTILNKKSGLLGVSGLTSDVRDLEESIKNGNEKAKLAIDMLIYAVKKYIGSYMPVLGKVDAITFTGGIGEHDDYIREEVLKGLELFGVKFDKNAQGMEISASDSLVKAFIIPTNEELQIAQETIELLK